MRKRKPAWGMVWSRDQESAQSNKGAERLPLPSESFSLLVVVVGWDLVERWMVVGGGEEREGALHGR